MSTHKPSLGTIFSEASHVINSNSTHFSILSLIFLLPISISTFIFFVLQDSISAPTQETPLSYLIYLVLFIVFTVLLSICAVSSITYSAFRAYYNQPLSITTSLKHILRSFFPLLATMIVTQMITGLILIAFLGLMFLLYNLLVLVGVDVDYDSTNLAILVLLMTALLVIVLIYIGINWDLSNVIVVIESKWGFAPLKRSSYLVKGMRWKLLWIVILFGALSMVLTSLITRAVANAGGGFSSWEFLLQMTILAVLLTICSLYSMVVNVVLFVHCKELHGEFEDVSGSGYVRLGGEYEQVSSGVDVV